MDALQWMSRAKRLNTFSLITAPILIFGGFYGAFEAALYVHPKFAVGHLFIFMLNFIAILNIYSWGYVFWTSMTTTPKKTGGLGFFSFLKLGFSHFWRETMDELPAQAAAMMEQRNALLSVEPPPPTLEELTKFRQGSRIFLHIGFWVGIITTLVNWVGGALIAWSNAFPRPDIAESALMLAYCSAYGYLVYQLAWFGLIRVPRWDDEGGLVPE